MDDLPTSELVKDVIRHELRVLALAFFRAFSWTFAGVSVLVWFILIVGLTTQPPKDIEGPLTLGVYLLFAVAYAVAVGLGPALAVGTTWTTWRVTRLWTVLPVVLVPSGILLSWAALRPWVADYAARWVDAVPLTTPVSPERPLLLLLALPIMLYDMGFQTMFVEPGLDPLAAFGKYVGLGAAALLCGIVPSILLSGGGLVYGYWQGFKRRYPELFAP